MFIRTIGVTHPMLDFVDHVFYFLHPVVFIQTAFFLSCTPCWFWSTLKLVQSDSTNCSGLPHYVFALSLIEGSNQSKVKRPFESIGDRKQPMFFPFALWCFYLDHGFLFLHPMLFIQAAFFQNCQGMFLYCPCAQSGRIEYFRVTETQKELISCRLSPVKLPWF